MAGFNTQFHATRDELIELIETWMDQHPIVVNAFGFPPASRLWISRDTVREVLSRGDVGSMAFTMNLVDPTIKSAYDVARAGLGPMQLNIGRLTPRGLEQSALTTIDPNPLWKKLNSQLKRQTTAGADYLHEENGTKGYERIFRFSPGAKAISATGVALRQFAAAAIVFYPK